ncbi:transport and Golgi organization protein 6 homolog isoform X2 [Varroa destructor]|uniref:RNA polymerase II assembly factor Rtp1 C-terminal domain-containing protein n=1 Tax=Varroa destructor TaxID=109461 RepID=A0A7M7JRF2_VARDE|nr:transport and Golgi organization protein 6 homolog isoform X2 [Varroa destructor]
MLANGLFGVLEKLKDDDWENCQSIQKHIDGPIPISTDPSWRKVQHISLLLDELSRTAFTDSKESVILSVSQRKTLSQTFDFLVGYSIRPNLLPAVWRSTQKTPASEPVRALQEHRRLVGSINLLLYFASIHQFGSLLYEKHLADILITMFQLCHAPIRKVSIENCKKTSLEGRELSIYVWLTHGLEIKDENETITVESVVAEMKSDRMGLLPKLDNLLATVFQPAMIKCLLEILSHANPAWLRKACSSRLSNALLRKNGLAHLLTAVSDSLGADIAEWKRMENFALLVARCPSFIDQESYFMNIGDQLRSIMYICKDLAQFRLIVAVLNSLLACNSILAIEHVFCKCFKNFVDVLRGLGAVSSEELRQHFEFVSNALDLLPHDAVLLEAFATLMPVYLKVAAFSHKSASSMTQQATEMVAKLTDKIEEGPLIAIGIFDPSEIRFQMHPHVNASFANNGGVQLTTTDDDNVTDNAFQLNANTYVELFISLGKTQFRLIPRLFFVLLSKFDQLKEDASPKKGIFFGVFVASLITAFEPLVQKSLKADVELMTEFTLVNLQRYCLTPSATNDDDSLTLILGMLETLTSNSDQLSLTGLSRLKLASKLLKDISGPLTDRCNDLVKIIDELEVAGNVKSFKDPVPFLSWKFAPIATKALLNIEWNQADSSAPDEDLVDWREPTLEELIAKRIQKNQKSNRASIYGTTSIYRSVKHELHSPDIAIRGHGFIQLRKLLSARNSEAVKDIDTIVNLCRQGMEESDSYIYLGAVQCFAQLVELDTARQLPVLIDVLSGVSTKDNRIRVLLAECLARCVPSFGDMMSVYSKRLIEVLFGCCSDEEELIRVFGCSLLGEVIARLLNVERIFHQSLNIIVALMTSDESDMVRLAAAEGLATLLKNIDKSILARDYGGEVRDLHRVVKHLYARTENQRLQYHLQEVLFALGDLAKKLLRGRGIDKHCSSRMREMRL